MDKRISFDRLTYIYLPTYLLTILNIYFHQSSFLVATQDGFEDLEKIIEKIKWNF